ncbi:hypothetical protein [Paenibacillus sp. FSL H3-0286]|uniref:hypothetical protein n=1 Tax=Paenibacillus sp. FSL H3-0286 TaxID=2921427 RepID=UPI003249FF9E
MTQIKISEYIDTLQKIKEEHGDLGMFEYNDYATISKVSYLPKPQKIYSQKWVDADYMKNELSNARIDIEDKDLYNVNLKKPIIIGVVI